jgi:uncharacterized membrane protein YfcA
MEYAFLIILIYFVGFFVKGLAGFGDPLITSPLMAMIKDNKLISPVNLLLGIPVNTYIAFKNRKSFDMKTTIPIVCFIIIGVIPGTLLLKYATSWTLKVLLGLVILGIGVEMFTRVRSEGASTGSDTQEQESDIQDTKVQTHKRSFNPALIIACFFSGVTAGLYGINLFFVAYIERHAKDTSEFKGNICFVFLIESVIRLILYIATGIITKEVLIVALIALPGAALGMVAGFLVDTKLSEKTIRIIIIGVFMLAGVSIVAKALILKA